MSVADDSPTQSASKKFGGEILSLINDLSPKLKIPDRLKSAFKPDDSHGSLVRPAIPDMSNVGMVEKVSCFTCIMFAAVVTVLLTSGMTDLGHEMFLFSHWVNHRTSPYGLEAHIAVFSLGGVLLCLSWFIDIVHWQHTYLRSAYYALEVIVFGAAGILYAEYAPSMLVLIGLSFGIAMVTIGRRTCWAHASAEQFNFLLAFSYFSVFLIFMVFWVLWAYSPIDGYHKSADDLETHHSHTFKNRTQLSHNHSQCVMEWISPVVVAVCHLIVGLFVFKRGQFHVPDGDIHVLAGVDGLEHQDNVFVDKELRFMLYIAIVTGLIAYLGASLAASDVEVSHMVLRVCAFFFFGMIAYVWVSIGLKRIVAAAEEHPPVRAVKDALFSDWTKAILIAIVWPVLPLYFCLEFVHQRVRRLLSCCMTLSVEVGTGWLTLEASKRLEDVKGWKWGIILDKSITIGTIYYVLQVVATTGTTMFLSWLAETMKEWSLAPICAVLFFVGLTLFLIPVVPGLPIYLVAGIVIVQRMGEGQFWWAVTVASLLCWAIKLASNIVLMKCVGEPYADNVAIKMTVGTHTPTMRAAEKILKDPGLTFSKVAVLVGGPDWPTAVLCAMLKVPVVSMLVGISPVIVLIVPVVISAAYTLKAARAPEGSSQAQELASYSTNMMLLSGLVQMGSMVVASVYLHAVKTEYKQELEQPRKEDADVFEAVKKAEEDEEIFRERTSWDQVPCPIAMLLSMGCVFSWAMMQIVLFLPQEAFREFTLQSKLEDLPEGKFWNINRDLGWAAFFFLGIAVLCQSAYRCWCRAKASRAESQSRQLVGQE